MRHWTTEERARQSEIIQSWNPWDKSTGAKTIEGKAASSRNAYKGGFRVGLRALSSMLKEQQKSLERF